MGEIPCQLRVTDGVESVLAGQSANAAVSAEQSSSIRLRIIYLKINGKISDLMRLIVFWERILKNNCG